jgi:hypothetical protein
LRRFWIHHVLPPLIVALPAAAAVLIAVAVPPAARAEYLKRLPDSPIDWIILALGTLLYVTQSILAWKALRWRDETNNFDERPDPWLTHLAQAAEWFPLLGLIGTVAAILQTFASFGPGSRPAAEEIIQKYGPAITATGSGLFMALLNILPSWIAVAGRNLIRSLAGTPVVALTTAPPAPTGARS